MENIPPFTSNKSKLPSINSVEQANPFSQQWVTITKEEKIGLIHRANYWKAQHTQLKQKYAKLEEESQFKDAKIKDLQNRLFGKKSEKQGLAKSEKENASNSKSSRGQQPGSAGHGRTLRPDLPVISQICDLSTDDKLCLCCGLPYVPNSALDEYNEFIEVDVQAYTRRVRRPAYLRNPGCCCEGTPAVITAPALPRLIPRSPYQVSFWVDVLLCKFHYGQPIHRYLQDLSDRALPISPGTVAGGLQKLVPLFEPIILKKAVEY